jgi:hypothetical protein
MAYGSAQVTAYGSAQVTAYGSAQVEAWGSTRVTAWGSALVHVHSIHASPNIAVSGRAVYVDQRGAAPIVTLATQKANT